MFSYWASIMILLFGSFCEMSRGHPTVSKTIEIIKARLNISSIQCRFKSVYRPIKPELVEAMEEERGYVCSIESDFAFEKGNLCNCREVYLSQIKTKTGSYYVKEGPIWDSKLSKYLVEIENNSLPSLFKLFYNQYLKMQTINIPESPQQLSVCYYLNDGKPYIREKYKKQEKYFVTKGKTPYPEENNEDYNGFGRFGDPRYHIGYISTELGSTKLSTPYKHIPEFLEKEGQYFLSNKEEYTVLWHVTHYDDIGSLGLEIWVDLNQNISKIRYCYFPIRLSPFSLEEIKNILEVNEINCDSFPYFLYEIDFYDFKEFPNGIQVPLVSVRTEYVEDFSDVEQKVENLFTLYQKGKIDKSIYAIQLAQLRKTKVYYEVTLQIFPETLSINQDIPEDVFIPPPITTTRKELYSTGTEASDTKDTIRSWYSKYYPLLFIGACTTVAVILIVFSKKYLGWSL